MKLTRNFFLTMLLGVCVSAEGFAGDRGEGARVVVNAAAANPLIFGLKAHLKMGEQLIVTYGEHPNLYNTDVEIHDSDGKPFVRLLSHRTVEKLMVNPPLPTNLTGHENARVIGGLLESLALSAHNPRRKPMVLRNGSFIHTENMVTVQVLDAEKLSRWIKEMGVFIDNLDRKADDLKRRTQDAVWEAADQRQREGQARVPGWRPGPRDYLPDGREGERAKADFVEKAWDDFAKNAVPKENIISYLVGHDPR